MKQSFVANGIITVKRVMTNNLMLIRYSYNNSYS